MKKTNNTNHTFLVITIVSYVILWCTLVYSEPDVPNDYAYMFQLKCSKELDAEVVNNATFLL